MIIAIKCPKHDGPEYGSAEFAGFNPSHKVRYTCNKGYILKGSQYRTCGYNGLWDGQKPRCIRKYYELNSSIQ